MTIFEALRKDHDLQRSLADKLLDSSGESAERQALFDRLKEELVLHASAEERSLYVPMMEIDMTQEKARHSIAEHHEMDEYIEELEKTDMSSPHWLAVYRKLHHRLHHHLEEEEQEIFQIAGRAMSDARKEQLAKGYEQQMDAEREAA